MDLDAVLHLFHAAVAYPKQDITLHPIQVEHIQDELKSSLERTLENRINFETSFSEFTFWKVSGGSPADK